MTDPRPDEEEPLGTPDETPPLDDPLRDPEEEEIPAPSIVPPGDAQPEAQGHDPLVAELGDDGDGDLAPEDL